ncbi:MAG TPA: hypothetical protein VFW38_05910 [Solirubrobacteraceae bacterium]|nr:hypothetical protein [Solirubrobacteraceae bacterium]
MTKLDLLAAVVLETLVEADGGPLTHEQIALACERRPEDARESEEIDKALRILMSDRLVRGDGESFRATRAAIRAAQLSF